MTTESAGDRDAVLHAVMNKYHHHSCKDWNEHIVDTTISALRARGVSREAVMERERWISDNAYEIARLRAALELIGKTLRGATTWERSGAASERIAEAALNAGAKP